MTRHETAQQRARRHKANPYRAAQIAPSHPMPPVVCECGEPRLIHRHPLTGSTACLRRGCSCAEYREVTDG